MVCQVGLPQGYGLYGYMELHSGLLLLPGGVKVLGGCDLLMK